MKILLINPPNLNPISSVLPTALEEERGHNPPLGLLYIAAYLREKEPSYSIEIIDCPTENLDYSKIEEKIKEYKPNIVGVTVMSFTLLDALAVAKIVKKINPQIKIVFGGPHAHIFGKETLELGNSDFMVMGEGEKTFHQLVKNIDNEENLKKISGLIFYNKNHELINTGLPSLIDNLDELPFPARDLINNEKYSSVLGTSNLITTLITSRGCPYQCIFCDRPQLGKKFRARSAENVVNEMEECVKKYQIKEFLVYDDTFTIDRQRTVNICKEIIDRKLNITWDIRARVNTVDKELLALLKQAGCERIHYGVESGTQKILDVLNKGITIEQAEKAFNLTKKEKIQTLAYFMIGNPSETKEDILKTINFAKKLNPDYVHITITMPFPATRLYYLALNKGIISKDVWLEFAKNPVKEFYPPVWEEVLTKDEMHSLIKKAYREFYFRPSYLFKRILNLRSFGELIKKGRAGLKILKI
jgi:radical SAM superfamily enzyme YgiQ (UPF0313 family)